ncbi:MAG TPA: ATP-grasp domain-containing protein [Rhizomicrobium sp.]|nr:ATP-grasp domain-containing protein [Rhizomicrobium sp.]
MKTILIVSGGVEAADAARRAREMGLNVVVSDRDPKAPGFAIANAALLADVYNPEETARAAEKFHRETCPIDGVICVAADAPTTAAMVAARLGLPGITLETARLASDKLAMKECFRAREVPVPWYAAVPDFAGLKHILAERGDDLVIKPVDSRGSRGVQRLAQVTNLEEAFNRARQWSPTGRVMVEAYMRGPQISTESLVVDGICHTPGFSDRNYELLDRHAPFFIENGGDLPSRLPAAVQQKVRDVVAQAAAALGVVNGTVKGDMVVHDNEAYVIELAARLSGGFFCTKEIPHNSGVDFVGLAIRIALGEKPAAAEMQPSRNIPIVQRYFFPAPGKVVHAAGAEQARTMAGILEAIVTARVGDLIPPAGDKRPTGAMVIATGASSEEAKANANAALARIDIRTE